MHRWLALFLNALTLAALILPAEAISDNSHWTDADSAAEKRGTELYDASEFSAAEAPAREVLKRHPNSATALMYHLKALNAMGHYDQALPESRKAVALEPDNALAWEYLGMTLALLGQNPEAITTLEKSHNMNPDEVTTLAWLGGAYFQDGQKARSDQIFVTLMQPHAGECQECAAWRIANFFFLTHHGPETVAWWKRSFALGNTDAARYLEWAYQGGAMAGVPYDSGEAAYWQRRGPNDPWSWWQPVSSADKIIHWAHGWGLVLILLASTVFVPWVAVGIFVLLFRRGLTLDPAIHWTERARRSYPFYVALMVGTLVPLGFYIGNVENYPASLLPIPKWILDWLVLAIAYVNGNMLLTHGSRLFRPDAGTTWESIKSTGVILLLVLPFMAPFMMMCSYLPPQWNLQAALVIVAGVLGFFWVQYGGWIRLARLIRLLVPAHAEQIADATALAARWQRPRPQVYVLRWRKATAFAFPFSNAIVLTEGILRILNRHEVSSVMAHELAHLCEDRATRALRLFGPPLVLLPLLTSSLWSPGNSWAGVGIGLVILVIGFVVMRKRSRKMEVRADTFGKDAENKAGTYPLALAKLYEASLLPAVMPGKSKVHPHLYDRLLAAGITPDYPRPKPAGSWAYLAALFIVATNLIGLTAIWLSLF